MKLIFTFFFIFFLSTIFGQAELIQDINPGPNYGISGIREVFEFNDKYYFGANEGIHGTEFWEYDGDTAILKSDINPGPFYFGSHPKGFVEFNSKLYFIAQDSTHGYELWVFDGVNTSLVFDLNPGTDGGVYDYQLFVINNHIYFTGTDGTNFGFWKCDINENITFINTSANLNDGRKNLSVFNSEILFVKLNGLPNNYAKRLFKFDGQNEILIPGYIYLDSTGTNLPFFNGTSPEISIVEYQGIAYFRGYDYTHGYELWQYDGTSVSLVYDFIPGIQGGIKSDEMAILNNELYILEGVTSYNMYKYDGVNMTFVESLGYSANTDPYNNSKLNAYNNKLFYTKKNTANGIELWSYDGTSSSFFQEFNPGSTNTSFGSIETVGTYMFLTLDDGVHGQEYWRLEACEIQTTSQHHITACNSYISPSGNVYTSNGTYHDTIPNTCGEDSIITTHLTINLLDNSTTTANYTISANQNNANYQWLNCEDNSEIAGAVNQLYAPYFNGDYAVVITNNETGCSDTSDCVAISGLAIQNQNTINISVYPNPSKGIININGLTHLNHTEISIYNTLGQSIPFKLNEKGSTYQIELNHEAGLYFIQIKTNQGVFEKRVVLE